MSPTHEPVCPFHRTTHGTLQAVSTSRNPVSTAPAHFTVFLILGCGFTA